MKSILLHVQPDEGMDSRLQFALDLARATGGHLSCLHVTPAEAYVAFDSFGGVFVMEDVVRSIDEQEAELRARIERQLAHEDVPWDYEQVTGPVASVIASRAALADVIVATRERDPHRTHNASVSLLGDLLQRSRTPLFVPGTANLPFDPTGPALIMWDGSFEAAHAVRQSLGLLALSSSVRIVRVDPDDGLDFPSTRLPDYLSRHGIHAELDVLQGTRDDVGEAVMLNASRHGASYVVAGGYGHSRIGEYWLGGVTRGLLLNCPIPLLIAH